MNKRFFLLVTLFLNFLFSFSQNTKKDTLSIIEISDIVVSVTKISSQIKDIPVRVEMLSEKEIQTFPAQSVDDLLKNIPGLNIKRSLGIYSHRAIVSMRGLGGDEQSKILILIDGIPMNKTDGGSVNWNMFNTAQISRVEILKGPGSSLYGGNSMGGVVNIITKSDKNKISGNFSAEYGTYNTMASRFHISASKILNNRGIYGSVNGFYRKSDGYITAPEDERDSTTIKSNLIEYLASAKVGYRFNRTNTLEYNFDYYYDFRGQGTKIRSDEGTFFGRNSYYHKLLYKGGFNDLKYSLLAYYNNENYERLNESIKIKNGEVKYKCYSVTSKREDAGALFNISKNIGKTNVITGGIDFKQGKVTAADVYKTSSDIVKNEGTSDIYAVFAQDELKLIENKLIINAGLRYDYSNFREGKFYIVDKTSATDILTELENNNLEKTSWQAFSPKISGKYFFIENFSIYTSYARGFRAPVLDDLCRSGFIAGAFKKANPELKPEYVNNYELGFDVNLNKIIISVSAYYSEGIDFMYYVSTGDSIKMGKKSRPVRKKENIGKIVIKGAELNFKYQILNDLKINANYTFTDSRINNFISQYDLDLTGKYLRYVPKHQISANVSFLNKIANVSLSARYKSGQFRDDLNEEIFNAHSEFDCKIWKNIGKHFLASINIQNVTNVIYTDDHDYFSPGRFITGTISVKF